MTDMPTPSPLSQKIDALDAQIQQDGPREEIDLIIIQISKELLPYRKEQKEVIEVIEIHLQSIIEIYASPEPNKTDLLIHLAKLHETIHRLSSEHAR